MFKKWIRTVFGIIVFILVTSMDCNRTTKSSNNEDNEEPVQDSIAGIVDPSNHLESRT